ncbi:MAG: SPOR domain-containing protein [bacterium]
MWQLLLLLILLNLSLWVGSIWSAQSNGNPHIPPSDVDIPTLTLLPETPGQRFSSRSSLLSSSCYSVGPFNSLAATQLVGKRVTDYGLDTTIRAIKSVETLNYFIYIPPVENRAAAIALVKDLAQHHVKKADVVTDGTYQHAISLGFYASLPHTKRYTEYIRYLGYDARYIAQKTPLEVYWLDYDEPLGSHTPVLTWASRIDPTSAVQKIPRDCY